jgi:hypothetical protein
MCELTELLEKTGMVKMKTVYEICYWLKDDTDIACTSYLATIKQAVERIKEIKLLKRGYHDFVIRGVHVELVDDSFTEGGRFFKCNKLEKIYDDYEAYFNENGKSI